MNTPDQLTQREFDLLIRLARDHTDGHLQDSIKAGKKAKEFELLAQQWRDEERDSEKYVMASATLASKLRQLRKEVAS